MSSQFQTIAALVIVALAATWLITRTLRQRSKPGCGGECGCKASELKAKLSAAPHAPDR